MKTKELDMSNVNCPMCEIRLVRDGDEVNCPKCGFGSPIILVKHREECSKSGGK